MLFFDRPLVFNLPCSHVVAWKYNCKGVRKNAPPPKNIVTSAKTRRRGRPGTSPVSPAFVRANNHSPAFRFFFCMCFFPCFPCTPPFSVVQIRRSPQSNICVIRFCFCLVQSLSAVFSFISAFQKIAIIALIACELSPCRFVLFEPLW